MTMTTALNITKYRGKKKKSKDAPARSAGDDFLFKILPFLYGENRQFLSKGICR